MAKTCKHPECTYPVFSHLYCKIHQSERDDPKWLATLEKRYTVQSVSNDKEKKHTIINKNKITPKKAYYIPKISKKKIEELKEYRVVRDAYLKANPVCEVKGCCSTEVELHHKMPRAYYLCDTKVFMSVCRKHHLKIEESDSWARENGYKINHL